MARKPKRKQLMNLVVVSDTHCGCMMGLCPPGGVKLDGGGTYTASSAQCEVWKHWTEFWNVWVPMVTRGEPFAVCFNGDAVDGVHHGSVTQVSHNLADQCEIAYQALSPVVEMCNGRYYHIRGTEAHVGQSGQEEERLAMRLGAIPDQDGRCARWELRGRVGRALVNIMHHIGTAGSMAYETSAIQKELEQSFVEAARWNQEIPDVVVRSHRHRHAETRIQTHKGFATSCTTPGWQLKTPFVFRVAGARQTQPQIGGILIRCGDEDVYTRPRLWNIEPPNTEEIVL